jgi:hypothetical protein
MKLLALFVLCFTLTGWQEVLTVSGKGTKQTETFKIKTKEWRISWTIKESEVCPKCGVLLIHVYKDENTFVNVAASVQGADTDSTIMRGAGEYYLKISGTEPWTVKVEQPTVP